MPIFLLFVCKKAKYPEDAKIKMKNIHHRLPAWESQSTCLPKLHLVSLHSSERSEVPRRRQSGHATYVVKGFFIREDIFSIRESFLFLFCILGCIVKIVSKEWVKCFNCFLTNVDS